jgi:outer membrane protein assembly factor BamE (lipoprotein component of BamABCDE complex)
MPRPATTPSTWRRRALATGLCGMLTVSLAACEARVELRGNDPLDSRMEQIEIDRSTQRDVVQLIGTPSTVSTFDPRIWYYMSQVKESWAFYTPEVVEHQVLAFHFDDAGVLREIKEYDKDSLREVAYREKETPTSGRTMSIVEQLFGNFGKIGG